MTDYVIDGTTSAANDVVIASSDTLTANSGGQGNNITVGGGRVTANTGSTLTNVTVYSGTLILAGGNLGPLTMSGGTSLINSGSINGTFAISGGTITIGSSAKVTTASNSTLSLSGGAVATVLNTGALTVQIAAGSKLVTNTAELQNLTINGSAQGFTIDITDLDPKTIISVDLQSSRMIIYTTNGTIVINGSIPGYKLSSDGSSGLIISVCFAKGTLILTPSGKRPVETIGTGDTVVTDRGVQTVIWAGSRKITLRGAQPDEAFLVRIRRNAFGAGEPLRDLLVTPEHCVFVQNSLVPVRMLVNGGSIFYDRTIREYTYYHLEVENHALLYAENLRAESYYRGTNSLLFGTHGGSNTEPPRERAYPLMVERPVVEKIWRELTERAGQLGYIFQQEQPAPQAPFVLTTPNGRIIARTEQNGPYAVFMIPSDIDHVYITTQTSRPDQAIGPYVDDRRDLGVLIGQVKITDRGDTRRLDDHLTSPLLGGWSALENSHIRWTTTSGLLPLPQDHDAPRMLKLEIEQLNAAH